MLVVTLGLATVSGLVAWKTASVRLFGEVVRIGPGYILAIVGAAACMSALVGLIARRQAARDGQRAWLAVACALAGGALAGYIAQRWLSTAAIIDIKGFPLTSAAWDALVRDFLSGLLFVLFLAVFTVTIDLFIMIAMLVFASLLPLAVLAGAPFFGGLFGALVAKIPLRIVRGRDSAALQPRA